MDAPLDELEDVHVPCGCRSFDNKKYSHLVHDGLILFPTYSHSKAFF
jgi:hypothetical protein